MSEDGVVILGSFRRPDNKKVMCKNCFYMIITAKNSGDRILKCPACNKTMAVKGEEENNNKG